MAEWESILKQAAEKVQTIADSYLGQESGRKGLGVGAGGDITMRADADAEKAIVELIQVPDARVVAEESGETGATGARWTVVVDPIDGSWNYSRGLPFYCTSIAVLEGGSVRDIKHALVRNLVNGDVYYAEEGRVERNGRRIETSKTTSLKEACVGIDLSKAGAKVTTQLVPLVSSIRKQVHFGANALEMCFLAEGRIDGFVDMRGLLRIVDFAAAYKICLEAGAVFSDDKAKALEPRISLQERFNVVGGANDAIHQEILSAIMDSDRAT